MNLNINPEETSRYKKGVVFYSHKGKTITSTVGNKVFEDYTKSISEGNYRLGKIPAGYASRPDSISRVFFGNVNRWWLVMLINNFTDPFESIKPGYNILLPKE